MEAEDSGNLSPEWLWRRLAPAVVAVVFCCKKNPHKNQADAQRQEEKDETIERGGGLCMRRRWRLTATDRRCSGEDLGSLGARDPWRFGVNGCARTGF